MGDIQAELEIFHHLALERIVTRIKKLQDEAEKKKRCPITKPIPLHLFAQLNKSSLKDIKLHATYSLAFAAFLRIREFIWSKSE